MSKTVTSCTQESVYSTISWFTTKKFKNKILKVRKLKKESPISFINTSSFIETKFLISKVNSRKVTIPILKKYITLWCPLPRFSNSIKFNNSHPGNQLPNSSKSWLGIKLHNFFLNSLFTTAYNKNFPKVGIVDSKLNSKHSKIHSLQNIQN